MSLISGEQERKSKNEGNRGTKVNFWEQGTLKIKILLLGNKGIGTRSAPPSPPLHTHLPGTASSLGTYFVF